MYVDDMYTYTRPESYQIVSTPTSNVCRVLPQSVWWSVVHILSALSAWYLLSYVLRKTLKLLLTYQGWMIERHK